MLLLFTTLKRKAGRQMQFLVWTCNKTENTLIHLGHHSSDNHGSCTNAWKKYRQVKSRISLWFRSLFCAFHCFLWSHMEGTKRTWKTEIFLWEIFMYSTLWIEFSVFFIRESAIAFAVSLEKVDFISKYAGAMHQIRNYFTHKNPANWRLFSLKNYIDS